MSLVLLGALAVTVAGLIGYARHLNREVDLASEAQADNLTWFTAQIEVELLRVETALLRLDDDDTAARQAFDIFYSRVSGLERVIDGSVAAEREALQPILDTVSYRTRRIAELFDDPAMTPERLRAEGLAEITALRPVARDFALQALATFIKRAEAYRLQNRETVRRFSVVAILLVLLLSAILLVIADLYRDMLVRNAAIGRATSNLRKTLGAARDAAVVTDGAGRIREWNTAAAAIFGHPAETAIGQNLSDLIFTPDDPMPGDEGGPTVLRARHAAGAEIPVEVTIARDRDADGAPIDIVFLRDIRDQVALESSLRRARDSAERNAEARARFLAVMSHEMRTPLQGLLAALDLMNRGPLSPGQRRHLQLALSSGQTALDQVEDLLELTRQERDTPAEMPTDFDPGAIARTIVGQSRPLAAERGNRILLDPASPTIGFYSGPRRSFERALGNLVSNAVKFTRNGEIEVRLRGTPLPDGGLHLTVSVSDTGAGIDPRDHARVFEDFETLGPTRPGGASGTGLGLGIVSRAVADLGGAIELDSAPGRGSRFTFTARLGPSTGRIGLSRDTQPAAAAQPLTVLLAEDTAVNQLLLREMLERMGHRVSIARDGLEAVAIAGERAFDALVMDISMPGLDGLEASRRIRQAEGPSSRAPVLGLTAHALPEDRARLREGGIERVVTKPVRFDALEASLEELTRPPNDPLIDRQVLEDSLTLLPPAAHLNLIERFRTDTAAMLDLAARGEADAPARHSAIGASAIMGARRLHRMLTEWDPTDRASIGALRCALAHSCVALAAEVRAAASAADAATPQIRQKGTG
ncbi:MAG: ATP-binding protein [Gemmobacter sp.]